MQHKHKTMHRAVAAVAAAVLCLMSGCSSQSRNHQPGRAGRQMTMVISSDAPESVQKAAEEFANRVAYYSDGELQISLSESQKLESVLGASDSEFAMILNEQLTDELPELTTLELPFYFKHADNQFSALNSERTRTLLNRLIGQVYPMQVQMATVCGYEDFAADASVDLTDFRKRYPLAVKQSFFVDELQQDLSAQEIETEDPMALLLSGQAEIAAVELQQVVSAMSQTEQKELVVLDSAQKIKTVYLLSGQGVMDSLTPRQQAAVEQAAAMACGYCRTLSDQKRQQEQEQLRQMGVEILSINLEKYYAMMGDIYQYETDRMLYQPDAELDRIVRSDSVKETF